jgi:hypothetical protein
LFGIVQQTTKRNMIAVPIFQFVHANAVPIFQLGAANAVPNFQFVATNAVPNFQIANLSLQMQCQLAVRNINAS